MSKIADAPQDGLLGSLEVVKLIGATYRQLDCWCRPSNHSAPALVPTIDAHGYGTTRWFDVDKASLAAAFKVLSDLGAERRTLIALSMAVEDDPTLWNETVLIDVDDTIEIWSTSRPVIGRHGWVVDLADCRDRILEVDEGESRSA